MPRCFCTAEINSRKYYFYFITMGSFVDTNFLFLFLDFYFKDKAT